MGTLIPFLLGLLVTAGLLVPLVLRLRSAAAEAQERTDALGRELAQLQQGHARIEAEQQSLTQFLKEFPHLARDLFSGLAERHVTATILQLVQRSLDPAHTVVLVAKGRSPEGERTGPAPLVVAAVAPEGSVYRLGTEVPSDRGEIGFAVETQLVTTRQDLSSETAQARLKPGAEGLAGLRADFIAPLVFDQETLGVIVVARPRKTAGDTKAALRLIAQTSAQALHAAASYSRMRISAEMDSLTQTFNKRHLEQALNDMIYRTACATYDRRGRGEQGAPPGLSVVLFDIDNFKHYNDTNGHLAGDKLLMELARCVQQGLRDGDILGRFGGEEFLLILPGATLAQAVAAAEKLRTLIAEHAFPHADRQPLGLMSVSGGVAEYPRHGMDADSLLQAADAALYDAKRSGRNRMSVAALPQSASAAGGANSGADGHPAPTRSAG
jgi:diguanylate cyclase (GGDEF)-like protein